MQSLTIRRPDDWHVHLRDGEMLRVVASYTARQFARAIVMPNLAPPVTTIEAAAAYRDRIGEWAGPGFTPLMTCYLTDRSDPDEIARGFEEGVWTACKLYPANATTNSAHGVTDVRNIYSALERMQEIGMVGEIAGHQRRKVGSCPFTDPIAVSRRRLDRRDRRHQIGHDDRPGKLARRIWSDHSKHLTVAQMDVPVVGTADGQALHRHGRLPN